MWFLFLTLYFTVQFWSMSFVGDIIKSKCLKTQGIPHVGPLSFPLAWCLQHVPLYSVSVLWANRLTVLIPHSSFSSYILCLFLLLQQNRSYSLLLHCVSCHTLHWLFFFEPSLLILIIHPYNTYLFTWDFYVTNLLWYNTRKLECRSAPNNVQNETVTTSH